MLKFVMFLYARYSVFYKKLNNYKFGFLDYDFQVRVRSDKCKWSLNSQKNNMPSRNKDTEVMFVRVKK